MPVSVRVTSTVLRDDNVFNIVPDVWVWCDIYVDPYIVVLPVELPTCNRSSSSCTRKRDSLFLLQTLDYHMCSFCHKARLLVVCDSCVCL